MLPSLYQKQDCSLALALEVAGERWTLLIMRDAFYGIPLDNTTGAARRAHRARQQGERTAAGDRWAETGYVFTTMTGKPVGPDRMTRLFRRCRDPQRRRGPEYLLN